MKRILSMLQAEPVKQQNLEKFLFYAIIYSLAVAAGFQMTGF